MSTLLSETLREVIAEHSVIVAHLAKDSDIDRTTLQHIIGGRRVPSKVQMVKLLNHIPIPEHKKTILSHAYEVATNEPDKLQTREKVKSIVEKIAFASMAKPSDAGLPQASTTPGTCDSEDLYGTSEVHDALIKLLSEEDEMVSFFMPPNFSFFYDTLFAKYIASPNLAVTCFFPISAEFGNTLADLEYFETFIPFWASAKHNFSAYYMRGQKSLCDTTIIPFPYFALTRDHVFLLSADMSHAVLTKQETFVRMYHKKCKDFSCIGSPLFTSPSIQDLLVFFPNANSSKDITASIECQPCFQYYFTEQLIRKYTDMNSAEYAAFLEQYIKYVKELQDEPNIFSAFGREGLMRFALDGVIAVWPPSLTRPLEVPDRIRLLELILHDIKNDKYNCRVVDTSMITIPRPSTVIGVRRKTVVLQCLDYENGNVKNLCFTAKNIVEAFADFFENLSNSSLVHSKEETVKVFEDALEKLKAL